MTEPVTDKKEENITLSNLTTEDVNVFNFEQEQLIQPETTMLPTSPTPSMRFHEKHARQGSFRESRLSRGSLLDMRSPLKTFKSYRSNSPMFSTPESGRKSSFSGSLVGERFSPVGTPRRRLHLRGQTVTDDSEFGGTGRQGLKLNRHDPRASSPVVKYPGNNNNDDDEGLIPCYILGQKEINDKLYFTCISIGSKFSGQIILVKRGNDNMSINDLELIKRNFCYIKAGYITSRRQYYFYYQEAFFAGIFYPFTKYLHTLSERTVERVTRIHSQNREMTIDGTLQREFCPEIGSSKDSLLDFFAWKVDRLYYHHLQSESSAIRKCMILTITVSGHASKIDIKGIPKNACQGITQSTTTNLFCAAHLCQVNLNNENDNLVKQQQIYIFDGDASYKCKYQPVVKPEIGKIYLIIRHKVEIDGSDSERPKFVYSIIKKLG